MSGPARRRLKVAVVASLAYSLVNFRLELLRAVVAAGHEVVAVAPERDGEVERALAAIGVTLRTVPMARTGTDPLEDLRTLRALTRLFSREGFDVVLPYTMKPIVYGGLAARLARVPRRHALMTGLGTVYSPERQALRHRLLRRLSSALYRQALKGADRVFVYNAADEADILAERMLDAGSTLVRVPGSGVDLDRFEASMPPVARAGARPVAPTFLMIARLLREKGVGTYVEAARIVRARQPDVVFRLLGPFDANPTAIGRDELAAWVAEGAIVHDGETRDVRPHLRDADVFVLPSHYREGVPRTLLEAMAVGRALVTTDLPGCRDTVEEGINGFAVPPRDPAALAAAMMRFVEEPDLAVAMGTASRARAERLYDVRAINRLLLAEMGLADAAAAAETVEPRAMRTRRAA